ncbi:phosphatase, partial [Shigella flexneri]
SYFKAQGTSAADKRYGLDSEDSANGWEADVDRFDTNNPGYANEANRFGWIVEVDPWDPNSTPHKHTNMGRFKHEGANIMVSGEENFDSYFKAQGTSAADKRYGLDSEDSANGWEADVDR